MIENVQCFGEDTLKFLNFCLDNGSTSVNNDQDGNFTVEKEPGFQEEEKQQIMTDHHKKPHILITDDEEAILKSLTALLELDYRVFNAHNGEEAFNLIKDQGETLDILITDVNMPGMNGLELLTRAKELYPRLQVIVMTGYGSTEVSKIATEGGAVFYVEKPVSIEQLSEYVERALKIRQTTGFRGEVQTLTLIDIVQLYCMGQIKAALTISRTYKEKEEQGTIYFENGQVTNAVFGTLPPEKAFNYLISWKQGDFTTAYGVGSEERTIHKPWEGLLLEATRVHDEYQAPLEEEVSEQLEAENISRSVAGLEKMSDLSDQADASKTSTGKEVKTTMATKTEQLQDVLKNMKAELSDAEAILIVASDGTVFASSVTGDEATRAGAMIATFIGLSKKTCQALKRGEPTEGLIRGTDGLIAIYPAGNKAIIGVTTIAEANLAMLNMVCQESTGKIKDILG